MLQSISINASVLYFHLQAYVAILRHAFPTIRRVKGTATSQGFTRLVAVLIDFRRESRRSSTSLGSQCISTIHGFPFSKVYDADGCSGYLPLIIYLGMPVRGDRDGALTEAFQATRGATRNLRSYGMSDHWMFRQVRWMADRHKITLAFGLGIRRG